MDEPVEISIIIRTKDEEKQLGRLLPRIASQDCPDKFEIIVVDSGSRDKTQEIAGGFGAAFYPIKKPFSYGYALNYGKSKARGAIVVFLSAHCLPVDNHWLNNLLFPVKSGQAQACYGKQLAVKGVNPMEELELEIFFPPGIAPKAIFSNANCAVKKELLISHPFDEEIAYGEDFLWRNKLPGGVKVVYAPNAAVYHSHPGNWRYWTGHHERVGLACAYLDKKQGIDNFYSRQGNIFRQALSRFSYILYFIKKGYWRAIFSFPFIEIARSIYYFKGLRRGIKKYSV